ncbi:MAG: hypothetical protein J6L71_00020 [Clostridia bacterium]|nr:hypothetical protein [Clostridia bacterium]
MRRIIGIIAALVFTLTACTSPKYREPERSDDIRAKSDKIVHAAGELWGFDADGVWRSFFGSNSVEALEECGKYFGERGGLVELDFNFTSDGELVCIHNWSPEYIEGIEFDVALSYDEFMSSEIYWNFTPLDLTYVASFLRAHPEIYIVTDIKVDNVTGCAKIAETCPDLMDRFVIQIYSEGEYDEVRKLGFDNVIYTLYMLPWHEKVDTASLVEFESSHPLVGFTFPAELCEIDGFLEGIRKAEIPLYVHTINDADEARSYIERGITGVYTDYLEIEVE